MSGTGDGRRPTMDTAVLEFVRRRTETTRVEIARELGVTAATVADSVKRLLAAGLLWESGPRHHQRDQADPAAGRRLRPSRPGLHDRRGPPLAGRRRHDRCAPGPRGAPAAGCEGSGRGRGSPAGGPGDPRPRRRAGSDDGHRVGDTGPAPRHRRHSARGAHRRPRRPLRAAGNPPAPHWAASGAGAERFRLLRHPAPGIDDVARAAAGRHPIPPGQRPPPRSSAHRPRGAALLVRSPRMPPPRGRPLRDRRP